MVKIILGPILGYEWNEVSSESVYTVIVRVAGETAPKWEVDGKVVPMVDISGKLHDGSHVWRGALVLDSFSRDKAALIGYRILLKGAAMENVCGEKSWQFVLPAKWSPDVQPRIAFCSCNGFSDPSAIGSDDPLQMWRRMEERHGEEAFSLLVMGGDQLYCDELARKEGSFARFWKWVSPGDRQKEKPSPEELRESYLDHYLLAWSRLPYKEKAVPHAPMVRMMARIPSVMMWDDHDIFDGWGSYQESEDKQPYHVSAFAAAKAAFEIYQLRGSAHNASLLDRKVKKPRHYTLGLSFGPFDLLLLDNRTNRTPDQVMDERQWKQVIEWLSARATGAAAASKTLLLISPIPVVYRRFQEWITELPGEHGNEDDLRDHWSHSKHEGERIRLIAHLFKSLSGKSSGGYNRVTIVSGDVHVGAVGFLDNPEEGNEIGQIISSGIVHPEPTKLQWAGVLALSSDDDHRLQERPVIVARMDKPVGAKDRYLRCRNFAWFKGGNDGKLWVNWECEQHRKEDPRFVVIGLR